MSTTPLPEAVRHSALALALDEKLKQPQPVAFDHWGKFNALRERVSAHVGEMKALFPEFTAHDEPQHLARLFGIGDKLLGSERYERMNAAEIFILACGLYAHDWGMAVGRLELDYLRNFATGPTDAEIFTPLDDEPERLLHFAKRHAIPLPGSASFCPLTDDQLRSYVRETHAWRSGVRARSFFQAAGSGIPQAIERACQGHWLDFSQLDDEERFSSQQGVLGHTVNLRAIAIYIRLVDLFDIADDRTPYAVWRFVAPVSLRSNMEWRKHRALSPVTFPEHGDGRCVRFDGATTDPEVWAELEDLRRYCELQIEGSMNLLARHRDVRHQLDLRKLEWKVTADRFKAVNIRFEFNRERMFEILANEIYQGDSHVFLRELLQNSVDAVRMRKALLGRRNARHGNRRDVGLGFDDAIYFDVKHSGDGNATITCRDFGTGMDDYIVRNYLAVAGVSYYHSDDFRRLGLNMDPISRFGIGILSCFMVAERIEIETCREPQAGDPRRPLRLDIPAVDKQFRIYDGAADTDIGTAVTVHVLGAKLNADLQQEEIEEPAEPNRLRVSEYLCAIAGFVESPIVIDEDGRRTVILHPECAEADAGPFKVDTLDFTVHQLSRQRAWHKDFAPQDAHLAEQNLVEMAFDLKNDLGLTEYEGTVSYVCPRVKGAQIARTAYHAHGEGIEVGVGLQAVILRRERHFGYAWRTKEGVSRSSQSNHALSIFRDGLLIADADPPKRDDRLFMLSSMLEWPLPALRVNLPKRISGYPDVARRSLLGTLETWDAPIWRGVVKYLARFEFPSALQALPEFRIGSLATLAHLYHLTGDEMVDLVPAEQWPMPILMPGQGAQIGDGQLALGATVIAAPANVNYEIQEALRWGHEFNKRDRYQAGLRMWRGEVSVVMENSFNARSFSLESYWIELSRWYLSQILRPVEIRFVTPRFPGLAPLTQVGYHVIERSKRVENDVIAKTMDNPMELDGAELCALHAMWWPRGIEAIVKAVPFGAPFESFFASADGRLNRRHPMTCRLIQFAAAIRWYRAKRARDAADLGRAEDLLVAVVRLLHSPVELNSQVDLLCEFLRQRGMFEICEALPVVEAGDYIPVSKTSRFMERALSPRNDAERARFVEVTAPLAREFGFPLRKIEPEEAPEVVVRLVEEMKAES